MERACAYTGTSVGIDALPRMPSYQCSALSHDSALHIVDGRVPDVMPAVYEFLLVWAGGLFVETQHVVKDAHDTDLVAELARFKQGRFSSPRCTRVQSGGSLA